jgi:3-methyladenine DNA glycosylase AlkC
MSADSKPKFSLKDHLFNADSLSALAREYEAGVSGFSADKLVSEVLPTFPELELMERLEVIADGVETQLSSDFETMANQIEAAMPPELDPNKTDDDFGHFIHAVPGILVVRHGLEHHCERALDVLYEATKRFSMEYYIRPFLNRWPEQTLARLRQWCEDDNYHVRRLVSEGTRSRLPWAKAIQLGLKQPVEFLDKLYADKTRYVTRSVANHLNDIAKKEPDFVVEKLKDWKASGHQAPKEMDWLTRHALRTLIKDGHVGALDLLGFKADAPVRLETFELKSNEIERGAPLEFDIALSAPSKTPVVVDYVIWFKKADETLAPKTFKIKQATIAQGKPLTLGKTHKFKWDATTFQLHPGRHSVGVQVNGKVLARKDFTLK